MTNLLADVRLALRSWRKSPAFAAIAILSIALGIGANAAIFTLVDQVLLRPLPVRDPDELVQVSFTGSRYGNNWGDGSELSYPMFTEIRDNNQVFAGVFGRFVTAFHIGASGRTERVAGELVSGDYFPQLGISAAVGRILGPDDDRAPGAHAVAVLSHGYWTSRFGSDPSVVGTAITINSHPYTVVGVARPGFDGVEVGRPTQVFVPILMKAQITPTWNALDERIWRWVRVFARLRPGVSADQARAAVEPVFKTLLEKDVATRNFSSASDAQRKRYLANPFTVTDASRGRSGLRRVLTTPLWVLMATAAGVLLIACANIANLLLARGAARQREMAVRLALGATRGRLASQLLVESLMLACAGGIAGLAIAAAAAPVVLEFFVSPDAPPPISTAPDWRILAFTALVTMLTGVLFGIAPAFQSTRPNVAPTLKDQATNVLGGQARLRKVLVASQMAVSLLLLIGAALFIRTLDNLLAVDIGFDTSRLLSFSMDPSLNGYEAQRTRTFVKTMLERLNHAPGIDGAGLAAIRLLEGNQWSTGMTVAGHVPKPDESDQLWANSISPGYFKTMGIPLVAGRDFDERDEITVTPPPGTPDFRVAIVNERLARYYFREPALAIGKRIGFGRDPEYADAHRDRRRRPRLEVHGRPRRAAAAGVLSVSRVIASERVHDLPANRSASRDDVRAGPADRGTAGYEHSDSQHAYARAPGGIVAQPRANGRHDDRGVRRARDAPRRRRALRRDVLYRLAAHEGNRRPRRARRDGARHRLARDPGSADHRRRRNRDRSPSRMVAGPVRVGAALRRPARRSVRHGGRRRVAADGRRRRRPPAVHARRAPRPDEGIEN